jgi:hypothetical protein
MYSIYVRLSARFARITSVLCSPLLLLALLASLTSLTNSDSPRSPASPASPRCLAHFALLACCSLRSRCNVRASPFDTPRSPIPPRRAHHCLTRFARFARLVYCYCSSALAASPVQLAPLACDLLDSPTLACACWPLQRCLRTTRHPTTVPLGAGRLFRSPAARRPRLGLWLQVWLQLCQMEQISGASAPHHAASRRHARRSTLLLFPHSLASPLLAALERPPWPSIFLRR